MTDPLVRAMIPEDWPRVKAIYREGIATGHATFETQLPEWEKWRGKFLPHCLLALEVDGEVMGWAGLSGVSDRCVYGGVAEVGIYVAAAARGLGLGTLLLNALVEASEVAGLWTLQAGIFPENVGSVRVHEKCGFRIVGKRERLGKMNGVWRDVLLLERRSGVVGVD